MTRITIGGLPVWSVFFVGAISLRSVCALERAPGQLNTALPHLTAMGAGALLEDSIGHLLPETFASHDDHKVKAVTSICVVLLLAAVENRRKSTGTLAAILLGNFLHNIVDGILIGTSFLIGEKSGLLSTFAILFHEIPRELGVFGIMLEKGMVAKQAVWTNALSAALAITGTVLTLFLGSQSNHYAALAEPGVAAAFIYIACADLLPYITEHVFLLRFTQVATAFVCEIFLIVVA